MLHSLLGYSYRKFLLVESERQIFKDKLVGSLASFISKPAYWDNLMTQVKDLINTANLSWNEPLIWNVFPREIVDVIISTLINHHEPSGEGFSSLVAF